MLRILFAVFLLSGLCACECCPETSSGYNRGSCCDSGCGSSLY